jgi:hypothetical protein
VPRTLIGTSVRGTAAQIDQIGRLPRAAYVHRFGAREIDGMPTGSPDRAAFWMAVMTRLRRRAWSA